jgi:hypothetical protein
MLDAETPVKKSGYYAATYADAASLRGKITNQ